MTSPGNRLAHVVGLGLIGSSVALALAHVGFVVTGEDLDPAIETLALERGVITDTEISSHHELVVVATPASAVVEKVRDALARAGQSTLLVTDVAGVKSTIANQISDPRFIAGHPMAGSELRGLDGARADLFRGCTWVLTPTESTTPEAYGRLHGILRDVGANVVAVSAEDHDRLVAVASHVPHLLAGALMNEASRVAEQDAVLLQLAAGGFRDMTRVAAGDPSIWPDILIENRVAISQSLGSLEERLAALRRALDSSNAAVLATDLATASHARRKLPGRALDSQHLTYLRVGVSDQPGVLAAVTTLASEMLVNIYDIEIAHGIEGAGGILLLAVDAARASDFSSVLVERGFTVSRQ